MRPSDEEHIPSRSDRKRADKPVKDLARYLAELSEDACRSLPAPDDLKEEILAAIRTRTHGARKRQIKRLASQLRKREEDANALQDTLSRSKTAHGMEVQAHKDLETLRERICDPEHAETAVGDAVRLFPDLDRRDLQRLSRSARAARGSGDRRAYREIFQCLRRAREAGRAGGETAKDE